ncbi:L,D-transpeptidase family protein [Flavobacterium sp. Sd200]|uniref:L,D-transpeptidase family protein n=1 Tax=Flavobacterium sp. Sd200 TaxID=2692211 RepID=UPI00136A360E|nr:L,D-transpeptidase family protein [Flavobacterium sp. Sd200]MXN90135.1 L,D-transpeptidase family protein [Flavobacterium sp. Sd200]
MRKTRILTLVVLGALLSVISCKKSGNTEVHDHNDNDTKEIALDTTQFGAFFEKHPDFKEFRGEIGELYRKHNHYIWHEKKGFIEMAEALYNRVNQLDADGLPRKIPYKKELDELFENNGRGERPDVNSELLISSTYFYYAKKVLNGLDTTKSKQTGWFLPREKTDYVAYLDTLMQDPKLFNKDSGELFSGYYNLKKGLKKYKDIEAKGGWQEIALPDGVKSIKQGDDYPAVAQLRARLFTEGYLSSDSKSTKFDDELVKSVTSYETSHFRQFDGKVGPAIVKELNIPVESRIKTITVNMERCRWITPDIDKQQEYIAVNIPSYRLRYVRDGKLFMISNVVVGKELNKTVVFSGNMSYLAFAPYWNIPKSILEKEIKPGIAKNPNYLAEHNMEWHGNMVRQKPGGQNSLGKVKFMFPNSNNIYLHDTPAKSLFNADDRAFSHGCVRVQKARDLAIAITKKDGNWTETKVDKAMNSEKESTYVLKTKIPVYITYFTAWADENGSVVFFNDVYERDNSLADLLYKS